MQEGGGDSRHHSPSASPPHGERMTRAPSSKSHPEVRLRVEPCARLIAYTARLIPISVFVTKRAAALVGRAPHTSRHALSALGHACVVGTTDPDGREDHAIRADSAAALGARDPRLAVRVPVAVHDLLHVEVA